MECGLSDRDAENGFGKALLRPFFSHFGVCRGGVLLLALLVFISAISESRSDDEHKAASFTWNPNLSKQGPILISVSLKNQTAAVYRNGVLIGTSEVSTGRPGHKTPTGVFHILNKDADHHSSTYHNAPMPYSQRLTWSGVALHAGSLPGYPSSHGCIHLPYDFAKKLFKITHKGGTVIITDSKPDTHLATSKNISFEEGPPADFSWNPATSPEGPVSFIYSSKDKKVAVIRNGIQIGEGPVETGKFFRKSKGTTAYIFSGWKDEGDKRVGEWIYPDNDSGKVIVAGWFKMDPRFRSLLEGLLSPGATLVITSDSLSKDHRSEAGFSILQGSKEEDALKQ
ncbi:MAG: L,D-transpeptidase family protein [Chthoniobacterales bacterium]